MTDILVCYLCTSGQDYLSRQFDFVESYADHSSGMEHDLLLIQKGDVVLPPISGSWHDQASSLRTIWHDNRGWDIASLLQVCRYNQNYKYVVWFGSNCRLLVDGWLEKLYNVVNHPHVGAVGACGSWEAGITREAPNPHLRTNCLMIDPTLLCSLDYPRIDTRQDCYEFEHGRDSLLRRLQRRSLVCLVVGVNGVGYYETDWPTSHTFRAGEQENLLVADKQTDAYVAAGSEERTVLAQMAWGSP